MRHALVVVVLTATAHAEPPKEHALSGTLSFTTLVRGTIDHSGARFAVGYDNRIDRRSSLGLRAGLSVRPDGFGSVVLPYAGVRVHGWLYPTESLTLKIGGGAELWFNSAPDTARYSEPVMVHVLAEAGPRFALSGAWFLDVPVELGMLGFFANPSVFSLQLGAQLGREW
jgi:hypothetical protein